MIVYPLVLYLGLPFVAGLSYYRWRYYKHPVYSYSSLEPLEHLAQSSWLHTLIPYLLRLLTLLALCLAIARIRQPDERTLIPVKGVDIMMVLDASGSMDMIDNPKNRKSRFTIAKKEALRFIKKRTNDPIGLVIFGEVALTRSPHTLDKAMLEQIIKETNLGSIPHGGTVLSKAILMAANRLKKSTAKSRIMIVLTDGVPSPNDVSPEVAIDLAKKLGIKIYTIGIGAERSYRQTVYGNLMQVPGQQYDAKLLKIIAQRTNGQFFEARSSKDMRTIYKTIDKLERTEQQMPVYAKYFEYFIYLLWAALLFLIIELILTTLLWVRL